MSSELKSKNILPFENPPMSKWKESHSCDSLLVCNCTCGQPAESQSELPPSFLENTAVGKTKICQSLISISQPEKKISLKNENLLYKNSYKSCDVLMQDRRTNAEIRGLKRQSLNIYVEKYSEVKLDTKQNTLDQKNCVSQLSKEKSFSVNEDYDVKLNRNSFDKAQQFFAESGILGTTNLNTSRDLLRETSKIHQECVKNQIRKTSLSLRSKTTIENIITSPERYKIQINPIADAGFKDIIIKTLQEEICSLNKIMQADKAKISLLSRQLNKLERLLQEKTRNLDKTNDPLSQLVSSAKDGVEVQVCQAANSLLNDLPSYLDTKSIDLANMPFMKRQGVSAESCEVAMKKSTKMTIPTYHKSVRSKQLIKEAIMENEFMKNIESSQVRELIETMYPLSVKKNEYVIREGEAGAHLYVSAEGNFEVVKNQELHLNYIGPGQVFGELAILYNCTRTASVRALSRGVVWVLDRRIYQQIMMRSGMERIENSVNFLRSVPLLENLAEDILVKIADVLEVEFYAAGTYIIRQGAKGDTFFLISQGTVKVTQKATPLADESELRTLCRGDYFGEQALINEEKRTANIIALAPGVECLTLDRDSFMLLIGDLYEIQEKKYADVINSQSHRNEFCTNSRQEFPNMQLSELEFISTLGMGGFGRVELVKSYQKNQTDFFALKCLEKQHIIESKQQEHVLNERSILLICDSPFICRFYRSFRDNKYIYLLLEACMGGEIWTMLRDCGPFQDAAAQFIIGCVVQAFSYLHSRGIVYRDLKPENLMLDQRGYVKLVDFGFAKYIGSGCKTWTFCGTPEYVSPEIVLNKGHDFAVDYWALGILIYETLNGSPPFTANDPLKTYNLILRGIDMVNFPKQMSRSGVQLIKRLCRHIPVERIGYQKGGMQDIKKHKWFLGFDWDGLENQALQSPLRNAILSLTDQPTSYLDKFDREAYYEPPDKNSGWDADF